MKRSVLALLAAVAAAPAARAAVADEFVCHVTLFDAHGARQLAARSTLAVVREPIAQSAGFDMSTAGSADLHAFAPQGPTGIELQLDYRHDLHLDASHHVARAVQTTCLTGTLVEAPAQPITLSSDGCNAANGNDVTIVDGAPAFDGNEVTVTGDAGTGRLEATCRHIRSILR